MSGADVISVRVPFRTVRRGGRKVIILPEGTTPAPVKPAEPDVDAVLLKAIVRGWRWRRAIEEGRLTSITEVAEQEGLTDSFVGRVLALTTLAPNIVQSIFDGQQPPTLTLQKVIGSVPHLWCEQRLDIVCSTCDRISPVQGRNARSSVPLIS